MLSQLRDIGAGLAINTDEILQGGSLIQHAAPALQPREIRVPPQRCDGDLLQSASMIWRARKNLLCHLDPSLAERVVSAMPGSDPVDRLGVE